MNSHYRPAEKSDRLSITDFQIAMALETENLALDRQTCLAGVSAIFDRPELGQYFVCVDDAEIVASLLITYEWSDWRNGMIWWIQSVYVKPSHRRRGIFAGLYRFVKGLVLANASVRGLRLYVERNNTSAQNVYARLGMNGEHYRVFEWMKE